MNRNMYVFTWVESKIHIQNIATHEQHPASKKRSIAILLLTMRIPLESKHKGRQGSHIL